MISRNLLEEEVMDKVEEVIKENDDLCDCEQCKQDIVALALNNLRPRYAGSPEGKVVLDSTDVSSVQTEMDVLRVVLEATEAVKKSPHHNR